MLKSKLYNSMIKVIEYYHLKVITAHHQLKSQEHWSLILEPSKSRVGTKPVEKTVLFCNVCIASVCFELQIHCTFLQSSSYNEAAI